MLVSASAIGMRRRLPKVQDMRSIPHRLGNALRTQRVCAPLPCLCAAVASQTATAGHQPCLLRRRGELRCAQRDRLQWHAEQHACTSIPGSGAMAHSDGPGNISETVLRPILKGVTDEHYDSRRSEIRTGSQRISCPRVGLDMSAYRMQEELIATQSPAATPVKASLLQSLLRQCARSVPSGACRV